MLFFQQKKDLGFKPVSKGNLKPIHGSIARFSTHPGEKSRLLDRKHGSARQCHAGKGKGGRKAGRVLQDVVMLKCVDGSLCFHVDRTGSSFRPELTGCDQVSQTCVPNTDFRVC